MTGKESNRKVAVSRFISAEVDAVTQKYAAIFGF
jgi:hypothetical protein